MNAHEPLCVTFSALRYRLVADLPDLQPLRILEQRTLPWHDGRLTFSVLGASHAVSWDTGEDRLTEMLTCHPPGRDPSPILAECAACRPITLYALSKCLSCAVEITPFSLEEGETLQGDFDGQHQLAHAFPDGPTGPTPVTRIGWLVSEARLTVETVHTYPETGQGVRSRSVFRPRGRH